MNMFYKEIQQTGQVDLWCFCDLSVFSGWEGDLDTILWAKLSVVNFIRGFFSFFICPNCGGDILYNVKRDICLVYSAYVCLELFLLPTTEYNLSFGLADSDCHFVS